MVHAVPLPLHPIRRVHPRREHGFSLIELLVSVVIGLVLTLAITTLLIHQEGSKRTLTSTNDLDQTAAYAAYSLDRTLRSAGSGFSQRWSDGFGCVVRAARDGTQILPLAAAAPKPFAGLPLNVRLAPLVIHKDASSTGSDVLQVMVGNGGLSENPPPIQAGSITDAQLRLPNTLGMAGNDMVMVMQQGEECMVQQVDKDLVGSSDQQVDLSGTYYAATIGGTKLTGYGVAATPVLVQLGNPEGAAPQFQYIGVGDNNTLMAYDLLRINGSGAASALADGVVEMHALYGLDTDNDDKLDTWQDPGSGDYTAAKLLDGSAAANARLASIKAVRVALVLRTSLEERDDVTASSIEIFGDITGLEEDVDIATADRKFRHRVVEFTVPLRNLIML